MSSGGVWHLESQLYPLIERMLEIDTSQEMR